MTRLSPWWICAGHTFSVSDTLAHGHDADKRAHTHRTRYWFAHTYTDVTRLPPWRICVGHTISGRDRGLRAHTPGTILGGSVSVTESLDATLCRTHIHTGHDDVYTLSVDTTLTSAQDRTQSAHANRTRC